MRFPLLVLFLIFLATSPSLAQGNSAGAQNESGQGNGGGQSQGGGPGNETGQGNSGNQGNNGQNSGNGNGAANAANPRGEIAGDGTIHYTPDHARDAVKAGQAVSLGSLLPDIEARAPGEIIDAELLNVRGFLVYAIRVLRDTGRVTTEYYYAQSGRYIGSEP